MESAQDAVSDNGDGAEFHSGEPSRGPEQSVAARLSAAREALGLTTRDISARTRITQRHVEALERGDFSTLPGRPYVLGFVRSYARVVGLDEQDIAARARREFEAAAPRTESVMVSQLSVDDPAKTPSSLVSWLALALFIVLLAAGSVFWRSYYSPGAALPALVTTADAPPPPVAKAPAPVATPTPAAAPTGPVVFTATEPAIWVKFYDGTGKQLLQKQLAQGESYTVPADAVDPKLWTGRPDALQITIGGQAVPKISEKPGKVRDVPVTAAALLARAAPTATAPNPQASPGAGTVAGSATIPAVHRPFHRRAISPSDTNGDETPNAASAPQPVVAPASPPPGQ